MKKVSIKDIARMAGVSPSTVSFVLNGKARKMRIRDAVSEKIITIANKQGYQPNQVAVSLRTGQSNIIGLMVESISGSFFAELSGVVQKEAEKFGYKVMYCSTENNPDKGRDWLRTFSLQQIDGYLVTPAPGMQKDIQGLEQLHKPLVLMDSYFPSLHVPCVLVDNYEGAAQGMDHLIGRGYRKIGFITVELSLIQIELREKAYTDYLKKHHIPVRKAHVLRMPYDCSRNDAVLSICRFLEENPELEAVFFATNYLGVLGLESLAKLRRQIKEDIAMLCFDDHDIFRLYPPGISVIRQPVEKIAQTAVHLLMEQLGKKKKKPRPVQTALPGKLIVRGSS